MGLEVMLPHSPSSSHGLASVISSPKPRTRGCRFKHRSSSFIPNTQILRRSRSFDHCSVFTRRGTIRRVCSASLEPFSDEEFAKKIEDLAMKFQLSNEISTNVNDSDSDVSDEFELPEEIIPANIEWKANSVELPFSLRIIKKKLQWKEGFREAGESACCSVKKAFSSMVFIIRELHSYTLQMREILFYEDLQGTLQRVQREMHASFVWLFQQVFSHTPTLMVYVMILLANFTVHSMGHNAAIAAMRPPAEVAAVAEGQDMKGHNHNHIDSSVIKTYSVSKGKNTASIGGGNGGGGKFRSVASGTDGDGRFDRSDRSPVLPDVGASSSSSSQVCKTGDTVSVTGEEEEAKLWNAMVDEASDLEVNLRGEGLDHEDMKGFVSPVTARIESDDYAEYLRTELVYQTGLSQDPNNALLLANYAQFLSLVAHDYDRAEEYFKRAVEGEPPDAEAYNKYATFLWKVKNDLWAAEETYLEAISAEPNNSFYAANYAHFLWNTGGEDTCFPLSSPDNNSQEA